MGEPPTGYPSVVYSPEFQPKEHAFLLYAHHIDAGSPRENTRTLGGDNWILNWQVYDGPKPDAKLVGWLQGIGFSATHYNIIVDLVFKFDIFHSRKFAMAQGIVKSHEFQASGPKIREFRIRAMVPTLGKTVPVTKDGPWGGDSGRELDITELPLNLESVTIGSGDVVDSIAFSYIDQAGNKRTVGPWGGDGGTMKTIQLAPTETVTKMAGTTADFNGNIVVTSISFATNLRTHSPFGIEKGNKFNTAAGDNIIVGFYARAGFQVNSIGVYVRKN